MSRNGKAALSVRGLPIRCVGAFAVLLFAIAARADDGYQTADGLSVYLGIIPASVVRGLSTGHAEGGMYGGVPSGSHQQHIVASVFDSETGGRIENADVEAIVSGLGHINPQRVKLKPMTIADTVTYGAFVNFPGRDRYEVQLAIKVPDRQAPVRVTFSSSHSDR